MSCFFASRDVYFSYCAVPGRTVCGSIDGLLCLRRESQREKRATLCMEHETSHRCPRCCVRSIWFTQSWSRAAATASAANGLLCRTLLQTLCCSNTVPSRSRVRALHYRLMKSQRERVVRVGDTRCRCRSPRLLALSVVCCWVVVLSLWSWSLSTWNQDCVVPVPAQEIITPNLATRSAEELITTTVVNNTYIHSTVCKSNMK